MGLQPYALISVIMVVKYAVVCSLKLNIILVYHHLFAVNKEACVTQHSQVYFVVKEEKI